MSTTRRTICATSRRAGLTLVELLVVIVILSLLMAAVLPVLTPSTAQRRLREASRGLNTFIASVQARAIATQRPYGFALKKLSQETGKEEDRGVCVEVYAVEQPPSYAGFSETSAARVALDASHPGFVRIQFVTRGATTGDTLPDGWDADLVPGSLIRSGDVVELNGNQYQLINIGSAYYPAFTPGQNGDGLTPPGYLATPLNNTGQLFTPVADDTGRLADDLQTNGDQAGPRLMAGWLSDYRNGTNRVDPVLPYWTAPAPYKIYRQPVTTALAPYQLPTGMAIDLEASGLADDMPFHLGGLGNSSAPWGIRNNDSPIYVLFTPEGSIGQIQMNTTGGAVIESTTITPTSNLMLLVGRRELIPADTAVEQQLATGSFLDETARETEKQKLNWLNLESRWVTVGAQSGTVATQENAFVDIQNLTVQNWTSNGVDDPLNIRRSQIDAAREFAREMGRSGG